MRDFIYQLTDKVLNGYKISSDEALKLLQTDKEMSFLFGCASEIKNHFIGERIELCTIVNAKSGNCPEDCAYCSQSVYSKSKIETYPIITSEEIFQAATRARELHASCFGIVTSGPVLNKNEISIISEAAAQIKSHYPELHVAVSIGMIEDSILIKLLNAGIDKIHQNLESAQSFFKNICTTHTYEDKVENLKMIKKQGVRICTGGIIGVGETIAQRIELGMALRELDVNSVPINFYNPIPGTKLEKIPPIPPLDLLKTVALFRFILPQADIKICGGREVNLKTLQPLLFSAGANGMMVGNYLTTKGVELEKDLQMMQDLELKI